MTLSYYHRGGCERLCWVVERAAPFVRGEILLASEILWPQVTAGTQLRCGSCEQAILMPPEVRDE